MVWLSPQVSPGLRIHGCVARRPPQDCPVAENLVERCTAREDGKVGQGFKDLTLLLKGWCRNRRYGAKGRARQEHNL